MNPFCFICGTRITKKTKILTGNLAKLLQLFCKLESVTDIDTDEWKYFNELHQSNCCSKCYDVLENMERVHDVLIETEKQLKIYLKQVEKLIVQSETRKNIRDAQWIHSNCSKIRKSILKKPPEVACNSDEFSQVPVKEELENLSAIDDPLGDHFNPPLALVTKTLFDKQYDWENDSNLTVLRNYDLEESLNDDFHNENESDSEVVQTGDRDENVLKTWRELRNSSSKNLTEIKNPSPVPRKKRKIIVVSEEDNVDEKVIRETSCRAAKLIAEKALKQYTPKDEDDILKSEKTRVSESEASCNEDNEPDTEPELKTRCRKKPKNKPTGRPTGINGPLFLPMVVAEENLYLFRWGTYVQRTYTHLHCKAHECTYQVEFDYYSSFQKMKDHILEEHRDRYHRQKTPHPCVLCKTLYKNQEEFRKHIKVHKQFDHPARAICECCLTYTSTVHARAHAFNHKNEEEQEAARAANDGNARCFKLKESQITERKFVCDFENCTKSFKGCSNLRRHKRSHLPIEQRTDVTVCPECGVRILKETLSSHMRRIHHPETVDRVLLCPICDKRYLPEDKAMLLKHIQVHKGVKSELCPECGVHCSDLNYHMNRYHKEPEPLPCKWCDLVYTCRKTLQLHLKRTHPEKFTYRPSFRSMSKFYSGNEPKEKLAFIGPIQRFPCHICEIVCKYRFTLTRHMSRKHGERDIRRVRRKPYSIKEAKGPEEECSSGLSNDEDEMDTTEEVQTTRNRRTEIFQGSSSASGTGFSSTPISGLQKFEN